jgi:hypothetical protein
MGKLRTNEITNHLDEYDQPVRRGQREVGLKRTQQSDHIGVHYFEATSFQEQNPIRPPRYRRD